MEKNRTVQVYFSCTFIGLLLLSSTFFGNLLNQKVENVASAVHQLSELRFNVIHYKEQAFQAVVGLKVKDWDRLINSNKKMKIIKSEIDKIFVFTIKNLAFNRGVQSEVISAKKIWEQTAPGIVKLLRSNSKNINEILSVGNFEHHLDNLTAILGEQIEPLQTTHTKLQQNAAVFLMTSFLILFLVFVFIAFVVIRWNQSEKGLHESQKQLIQAAKLASIGQLTSSIAHEINNPLFIVDGYTKKIFSQLKKENPEYDKIASHADFIKNNLKRLMEIVDHLKNFSRRSTSGFKILNLIDIIQNSTFLFKNQFSQEDIHIEVECFGEPIISGSETELEQVFLNIFSNAKDAIKERNSVFGGLISVMINCKASEILVTIKDNGIGMNEEAQRRLFDAFYTTKERGKGTGLGMSISYRILSQHGARITVDSKRGQGATFKVCFPYAPDIVNSASADVA